MEWYLYSTFLLNCALKVLSAAVTFSVPKCFLTVTYMLTLGGNLGFSLLPRDILDCGWTIWELTHPIT